MSRPTDETDPAEPDLYWAGHSGWAMLPGMLVGAALSGVVMLAGRWVARWVELPPEPTAFVRFWLVFLCWVAAALVWAYRGASFVYRLTPRQLYLEYGMLYRPMPPVPLADVESVECRAWTLRRLFNVGAVVVHAKGRPPVRMGGVFRPQQFADAIRRAVKEARGG
jgi:membrane protein YdbS with pleckstrin-like domain